MRICQARPWAEARPESLSGHGLDAGEGEAFRVPTWTAIGDWQPTGGDAAPERLGARHRAVNQRENP